MIKVYFSPSTFGLYPSDTFKTFPDDALIVPIKLLDRHKNGEIASFSVIDNKVFPVEYPKND